MRFVYKLDFSQPLDESELLGDICLIGDDNNIICEKDTFIDSWFLALCEGLCRLEIEKHCIIDIPEEPKVLVFDKLENYIRYGEQSVFVDNFSESRDELMVAVKSFLDEVKSKREEGTLASLRRFLVKETRSH